METISIIGGGASGVITLIALIRRFKNSALKGLRLLIFEPGTLGAGLAYGVDEPSFLTNTPVRAIYAVEDDHLHFFKWLNESKAVLLEKYPELAQFDENSFLPRSLVALYLRETLEQELKKAEKPIIVQQIKEWVVDLKYDTNQKIFLIKTRNNQYPSQSVVLATGYSNGLAETYSALQGLPNYYPSPYLYYEQLLKIPRDKRILIIGTRLTAIDTAVLLQNHADVTMASRTGLLPSVRSELRISPAKHLTPEYQKAFFKKYKKKLNFELIKKEIEKELLLLYGCEIRLEEIKEHEDPIYQLRKDLFFTEKNFNIWENSILSFIDFIGIAWPDLNARDKKKLLHSYRGLLQRFFAAFPYQKAKKLYELFKLGNLKILSGLKDIKYKDGQYVAKFSNGKEFYQNFDYVINATSADKKLNRSEDDLYRNLSAEKMAEFNYFGGIKVNKKYQIINKKVPRKIFYAIGPVLRGSVLMSSVLNTSTHQAESIAKNLLK